MITAWNKYFRESLHNRVCLLKTVENSAPEVRPVTKHGFHKLMQITTRRRRYYSRPVLWIATYGMVPMFYRCGKIWQGPKFYSWEVYCYFDCTYYRSFLQFLWNCVSFLFCTSWHSMVSECHDTHFQIRYDWIWAPWCYSRYIETPLPEVAKGRTGNT